MIRKISKSTQYRKNRPQKTKEPRYVCHLLFTLSHIFTNNLKHEQISKTVRLLGKTLP